jgi:cytochrome c oxidase cbb3-type subunit 3
MRVIEQRTAAMKAPYPIQRIVAANLALASLLAACHGQPGDTPKAAASQPGAPGLNHENRMAQIPLGDTATGPDKNTMPVKNPYAGSMLAVEQGKRLFIEMNCAGCHTYTGKGWMGPDLTDNYWRYGGSDDQIYKSVYEGRPQGMPAWGKTLPPESIWKLVTYIKSLSSTPAATPNGTAPSATAVVPATASDLTVDVLPPGAASSGNNPGSAPAGGAK